MSCQTRQVDLDEFFKYENQIDPAALSSHDGLYKTNKADLLTCLETITPAESVHPVVDSIAIDGSCLAHIVKPKELTFKNHAEKDFVGKVTSNASKQKRTDVVSDTYKSNSLKSCTRLTRGRGSRRRVTSEGKVPQNWPSFLQNEDNKRELYPFLADKWKNVTNENFVFASKDESAICNSEDASFSDLYCNHEETDTRLFVHVANAVKNNSVERAAILSNDTDIVVIAAALFEKLAEEGLKELWVAFGQSGQRKWLPIHKLFEKLGAERCKGLPFFHAFTGCDMVSGFKGKCKRTFFKVWNNFSDATDAFVLLSNCPTKQALELRNKHLKIHLQLCKSS